MKCAHPGCKCSVSNGRWGNYCSEHCQQTANQAESQCTCGHPNCK
jgi:hypothetical protein